MAAWRAIRTLAIAVLLVGAPGYARAQGQAGIGVVTVLVGEATVTRATMAQDRVLKKRDDVYPQDRITTKERSLVHVLMGGKALLTVRELSVLTVTEEGGRATVNLQSGKVGLAVVRERMQAGEVIEVHTPHAVAAVRGTVLVVEIVPGAAVGDQVDAGGTSTNVHLLHGRLDVSLRSDPAAATVRLESLQSVSVSSHSLGAIRPLSPAAAAAVTTGLKPDQPKPTALPEKFRAALRERQQVLAVATLQGAAANGTLRNGQGAQARGSAKDTAVEGGSGQDLIEIVSNAGGAVGKAIGSVFGVGNGDGSGRGNGFAFGSGGGLGQVLGSGPARAGNGLATVLSPLLQKKGP